MKRLSLPDLLVEKIARGNAILFLGAGASYGCQAPGGKVCPSGTELGRLLSDAFLGGQRSNEPLARIADYCESEAGRASLQSKIFEIFDPVEPQAFHQIIPRFRWRAIVTTNYDRVVEKAYESVKDRLQDPVVIIRNGDMARLVDNPRGVPIIKIHGCVSQFGELSSPLVLANEQYAKHSQNRERLASTFREMAHDSPVIFCGYQFQDLHIQSVLFGLDTATIDRPQYLAINPSFDDMDLRMWARHRVTAVKATFEEFLRDIEARTPSHQRTLSQLLDDAHGSISKWLKVGHSPTKMLQAVLHGSIEHVHANIPTENANAERFYRGDSRTWAPIKAKLDFSRSVASHVLAAVLGVSRSAGSKFILLKGHAGSGKSVVLRRVAWDAAEEGALAFYVQDRIGRLADCLRELSDSTGERVTIFIDNLLNDAEEVARAIKNARTNNLPVTFVAGVRNNEWFISEGDLGLLADEEFTVGDLSEREARDLCALLEEHKCLGELEVHSVEERPGVLMEVHGRQLLVALHEVTAGKPWRQIILDEYKNILPHSAQVLYLDICTLHRLGVLARAGLISRVSGIRFETFKDRFLGPLERVVSTMFDPQSRDYAYKARHRDIAKIVFEEVLSGQEDRANQIARIVGSLNTDYGSDDRAATSLLKGKQLADEFADRLLVDRIFEAAMQAGIDRAFVLQQRAVFELNHPGGSTKAAMEFIDDAIEGDAKPSQSLYHTKATIYKALAKEERVGQGLRDRYCEEALELLKRHGGLKQNYTAGSICEVLLLQTKRRLSQLQVGSQQKLEDEAAIRKLGELQRALDESLQRFPGDTFLTTIRADLHKALMEEPKAVAVLRRAHDSNPANEAVALRLARHYVDQKKHPEAVAVLRKSTTLNPSSKQLSYELARTLIDIDEAANLAEIGSLLRRSFTEGDAHFDAQFWHARHEYLHGDNERANRIYQQFTRRRHPFIDVARRRAPVRNPDGSCRMFEGSISQILGDFAFARVSGLAGDIFIHRTEVDEREWSRLQLGERVRFKLGFSFRGPAAITAEIV